MVLCPLSCIQNGDTALSEAAINGHYNLVKLLLKHDAQADHQDNVTRGEGRGGGGGVAAGVGLG